MALLLDVWRVVCKHLELGQAVESISPLVREHVAVDGIVVRRLDLARLRLEPAVAAWPGRMPSGWTSSRMPLRPELLREVMEWASAGGVRRSPLASGDATAELLGLVAWPGQLMAGLLVEDGRPVGLLGLASRRREPFGEEEAELAERLLEPVTVALANDARLQEMGRMRAALEADRRALLSRLARQDVSEAIVGADAGLRDVMEKVAQVAPTDSPVLILGETGTGKEVVARAIHAQSARSGGPVERVNCGAIPPGLVDSELFGHERGSFTGAVSARKGWFERADGGTLFLDEIGELPLEAQVRFLRILQDGTFERIGAQRSLRVDVRIVAATHRELREMVAAGQFRQDLWYRLNVFPIYLPPLRDRPQDIPALAAHFAWGAGVRLGRGPLAPTSRDLEMLVAYSWPGNVRELAAVIERAAILGNGSGLEVAAALGVGRADLAPPIAASGNGHGGAQEPPARLVPLDAAMADHIRRALAAARGRIEGPAGAARILEINPHTLRARMRKLGIRWSEFRTARR